MRIIFLIITLSVPGLSFSESIKYRSDIKPKHYNNLLKRQYETASRIDYDPEKKSFNFYINESLYVAGFTLTREQADSVIAGLEKYKRWNIKASKKGVTLEKEIARVYTSDTFWKVGNGDWSYGYGMYLTMHFLSQTAQKHQLVIVFPKSLPKYNKYSAHTQDTLYFGFGEAMKLKNALSEKSIENFLVKAKKQAEIDAEFN